MSLTDEALAWAKELHEGQLRKDGSPYWQHLARVADHAAEIARAAGLTQPCEEAIRAAALLHDAIEDTEADYEDIRNRFGPSIADAVGALSSDGRLPSQLKYPEYEERLRRAPGWVKAIKLADLLDNYESRGHVQGRDEWKRRWLSKAAGMLAAIAAEPITRTPQFRRLAEALGARPHSP